ncbi:MAG: hypothetical protein ACFWUA_05245 [Sporanaerobacter sp.]|jgi:hypothetical protein|uniref:hypothetical protein n=1 Tax=Sporanaerobacter sp. TaxID=2010183 RepID=UPI003A0FEA40
MSVDVYSYTVAKGTEPNVAAQNCISFLNARIDSAIVTNKASGIPSWVVTGQDAYDNGTILGSLHFSFNGTDFCIAAFEESVTRTWMYIYAQNERGKVWDRMHSFSKDDSYDIIYNFLIGQNQDYFLFHNLKQNNGTYLVIRIDTPTSSSDTDTFVSIIDGLISYNKSFDVENITNTQVYLLSNAGSTEQLYDSNFKQNYYNNKIPVYNIYAFTKTQGIRGKISNLITLTNSIGTEIGTFYSVNGIVYVGLGDLGKIINSYWKGILLRVY